ncbi:MAG: cation:proton antiporter [Firmicutes bacterium]|nr:cation:proton antiporter [Bacillota bacterium]
MLISFAVIMLSGLFSGWLFKKIHLPSLFGMIISGIIIGPYVFDLIDVSVLNISADIRKIALIIILLRAGLKLNIADLKKVGRPAILMCFLPACFEILGMFILAPPLLNLSRLDALILGAVVGAVSPAVIVPRMIKLIDDGYGTKQGIPQMILAGASVDDVFVIVMFTTFTSLAQGEKISVTSFVNIPISIFIGAIVGLLLAVILIFYFENVQVNNTIKTIILLSLSFILTYIENSISLPFAALIAVMCLGIGIKDKKTELAEILAQKYDEMWAAAEIFLFVSVGAAVAVDSLVNAGLNSVILIFFVLLFRMAGVFVCLFKTELNIKEKLFCMIAYTPKATVQAAIGSLPLAMGLSCGNIVLTVSVIAILVTAPLGAFGIDLTYKKLLSKK